jgi:hypothetical protein
MNSLCLYGSVGSLHQIGNGLRVQIRKTLCCCAAAFRKSARLVALTAFTLMAKATFMIFIQWHRYECEVSLYRVRDRVSIAEKSIAAHLPLRYLAMHAQGPGTEPI